MNPQFAEDGLNVQMNGVKAPVEPLGSCRFIAASDYQVEYLPLSGGQDFDRKMRQGTGSIAFRRTCFLGEVGNEFWDRWGHEDSNISEPEEGLGLHPLLRDAHFVHKSAVLAMQILDGDFTLFSQPDSCVLSGK